MKYFKCGKCQTPYKIDETKFQAAQITVTCNTCGTKNLIKLGPQLIARFQDGKVRSFSLNLGENPIGRKSESSTEAGIFLEDEFVSRNHAVIHLEQKENKIFCTIEDKQSTNGTYNSQKIKLKPGLKYPFLPENYFVIGLTKLTIKI